MTERESCCRRIFIIESCPPFPSSSAIRVLPGADTTPNPPEGSSRDSTAHHSTPPPAARRERSPPPGEMPAVAGLPCAGCSEKIRDRYYLLAMGRQWHMRCLTCSECGLPLDGELSCYVRHGNVYCRNDYDRLFRCRYCPVCVLPIPADELVLRAGEHVYHTHCFVCAACNKPLNKGEHFGLRGNAVYCRQHYCGRKDVPETVGHDTYRLEAEGTGPRTKNTRTMSSTTTMPTESEEKTFNRVCPELSEAPPRTKRVRTSFKHHQLRAMKSFFATNQNPDSKDLKQLAQKTGLNKRVLQVWFQNARAKNRRSCLRQDKYILQQASDDRCSSPSSVPSSSTGLPSIEQGYLPMALPFSLYGNPCGAFLKAD